MPSNTNYSETNSEFSSSSPSSHASSKNVEVLVGKKYVVKPLKKVRFTRRRHVRKLNKNADAVESRRGTRKKSKSPKITEDMDEDDIRILKEAVDRMKLTKDQKGKRVVEYIGVLNILRENGKYHLSPDDKKFVDELVEEEKKRLAQKRRMRKKASKKTKL